MTKVSLIPGLILLSLISWVSMSSAVTITAGSGPGGVDRIDVASNLRLWLVAGDISLADGTNITTWSNRATYVGAPSAAVVANTAPTFENAPADLQNGNPVLNFSGSASTTVGDVLTGTGNFAAEKTFFVVARLVQADGGCCEAAIHTNNYQGLGGSGGALGDWHTDWAGAGSSGAPNMLNQWGFFTGVYNNTSDPRTALYINGGSTVYTNSVSTNRGTAATGYILGSRTTNGDGLGRFFDGQIAETGIFNGVLNPVQQRLVENYLSSKYDIAVGTPANDVYGGDTLAKGNYDYDVFGIGSDGTNSVLTSGTGGFGLEASSLDGGDWLLAGNDGTPNGLLNYDDNNPDTIRQRWNRVWYVDKTGALDATLAFDFEDAGLALPSPGVTFQLLYSADSNFTDGFQTLAESNSISSGTVTFNLLNASLLDGYYTLGMISYVPEPSSLMLLGLGVLASSKWRRRPLKRRALDSSTKA